MFNTPGSILALKDLGSSNIYAILISTELKFFSCVLFL